MKRSRAILALTSTGLKPALQAVPFATPSSGRCNRHLPVDDRIAIVLRTIEGKHSIHLRHSIELERHVPRLRECDRVLDREPILEIVRLERPQNSRIATALTRRGGYSQRS